ncbi:hypothetical protein BDY17DRAFT_183585 [Neohortaea acidophila]|uniref:Uncharacterized protein n=1 Tax=Neohortaea acidophila TaxID=245834 RepID=A0A6A6PML0_9PEZI|nr:uncharacterized protein BDY17DRAFT_183585 [Neohortaea acidophila]KAF2481155.1 hypothetical protein BDY17DRAFT_183585 [Neohortaea acidophila]
MAPHFNEHQPYFPSNDPDAFDHDQDDPTNTDPAERMIHRAFRQQAAEQRAREERQRQRRALDPDAEEDEEDYEEAARLGGGRTPLQGIRRHFTSFGNRRADDESPLLNGVGEEEALAGLPRLGELDTDGPSLVDEVDDEIALRNLPPLGEGVGDETPMVNGIDGTADAIDTSRPGTLDAVPRAINIAREAPVPNNTPLTGIRANPPIRAPVVVPPRFHGSPVVRGTNGLTESEYVHHEAVTPFPTGRFLTPSPPPSRESPGLVMADVRRGPITNGVPADGADDHESPEPPRGRTGSREDPIILRDTPEHILAPVPISPRDAGARGYPIVAEPETPAATTATAPIPPIDPEALLAGCPPELDVLSPAQTAITGIQLAPSPSPPHPANVLDDAIFYIPPRRTRSINDHLRSGVPDETYRRRPIYCPRPSVAHSGTPALPAGEAEAESVRQQATQPPETVQREMSTARRDTMGDIDVRMEDDKRDDVGEGLGAGDREMEA